jgi:hypothetical protein
MLRGTFQIEVGFSASGDGRLLMLNGWSQPEPQYTFNNGNEARLVLPKLVDSARYELSIDVWPFVVQDRIPVQRLEVIVRGTQVMQAVAENGQRRIMRCEIPPHVVDGCESVDVLLRFPDAAAPINVTDGSRDTRTLAFAFFGIRFAGHSNDREAAPPPETG